MFMGPITNLMRQLLGQKRNLVLVHCLLTLSLLAGTLLSSDIFLQTVWTQIGPDKMLGLIWIQTVVTLIVFLKVFF